MEDKLHLLDKEQHLCSYCNKYFDKSLFLVRASGKIRNKCKNCRKEYNKD